MTPRNRYILTITIAVFLLCRVSQGDPGSNGYVYGSGAASGVGNAQVNSQSQSTWSNGLPSTYSQSMNNAGGSGISISGQANSAVNVDPQQQDTSSQVVSGNSNANSNGNAATGSLNNLDHSNSDNSNGLTVIGNSQITGNGTGVSVSNNVNSNVNKYPITTTTPYSCDGVPIACPAFCSFSGCGCICPIYAEGAAAAPNTGSKGSSLVKGETPLQRIRERGNTVPRSRTMQRSQSVNRAAASGIGNLRKRS
ncbi:homeobox protein 6-like [Paramacrobiotus metropolitanus]|uniref:homeobox protein 6-like n=1 Tax=Paramacrobiotus metropolitanus TaxID=2943436 RepID=UPI0024460BE3|nr:homeobox protein 6-like [Paramacrobiotus metropolitanus]